MVRNKKMMALDSEDLKDRFAKLDRTLEEHLHNEEAIRTNYYEFRGATDARLTNIEEHLENMGTKLDTIERKVTMIYGFAAGVSIFSGLATGLIMRWIG